MNRYAEAQARLEHAGGYGWRDHATSVLRGLGFAEAHLDRPLRTFSGGELTRASLARALGGDPDLLLLDEPTNHLDVASLEWLERELQSLDAAVILVAHDRWFLEAVTTATLEVVAGRGTFFPGPWHAWRREKAARMLHAQKEVPRVQADIVRLERFVERFRAKKDKAKQAQAKLTQIGRLEKERQERERGGRAAVAAAAHARLRVPEAARAAGAPCRGRRPRACASASASCCATRRSRSSAASTSRSSARTAPARRRCSRRCSAAARRRRARVHLGHGVEAAYFSQQELELDTRGSVLQCVQSMTGLVAAGRAEPARPVPLLRLGRAREGGLGAVGRRAAPARARGDRRVGRELPRARRADEPSRPREPRGARSGARGVPRHGAARVARPRAARRRRRADARDRGRRAALLRRRLGRDAAPPRRARGRARRRAGRAEAGAARRSRRSRARSGRASSSGSRRRSPTRESEVADLEQKLAEDWTNVEALAAHKSSRDALQALLSRWEQLFEQAST